MKKPRAQHSKFSPSQLPFLKAKPLCSIVKLTKHQLKVNVSALFSDIVDQR